MVQSSAPQTADSIQQHEGVEFASKKIWHTANAKMRLDWLKDYLESLSTTVRGAMLRRFAEDIEALEESAMGHKLRLHCCVPPQYARAC